jgi:predicted XRE-type DNA-binding protein
MTAISQYVTQMQTRQQIIATKLGCDISRSSKPSRVMNLALLVLIAALIKTLVDKGVMTDAEILATLNTARDASYNDEPITPPDSP